VISIARVGHVFRTKGRRVQALLETDLQIRDREFLTIVGPSGCGKSTLMNIIVGLFPPSSGEVLYRGRRHVGVNRSIGYVTQADNLLPLADASPERRVSPSSCAWSESPSGASARSV